MSTRGYRRYHILEADSLFDLSNKVDGFMSGMMADSISGMADTGGWLPAGAPFAVEGREGETDIVFCQAIYRR